MRGTFADAERHRVAVEAAVLEGQRLGVRLDEGDAPAIAVPGALAPDLQHSAVDVEHRDLDGGPAAVEHPEGDVAGAARDIEVAEGPRLRGRQHGHQRLLPGAVQPGRHEVVHEVVAARDGAEHLVDPPLLVAQRHAVEAEMRGVVALHRVACPVAPGGDP
jgi:hypothetical protein